MKIYIVTSGCYSDYGIDAVFTIKEKAEEYLKYNEHTTWSDMRIEEYDTSDDYSYAGYLAISCIFTIDRCRALNSCLNFNLHAIDVCPAETKKQDSTFLRYDISSLFPAKLIIERIYKEELFTEEEAKNKVLKIGQDLCTRIKAMYELEGYDFDDIIEYINNAADE